MPLLTFNFTSTNPNGLTQEFEDVATLPYKLPPNVRFTLKQVAGSTTASFSNTFKYILVYFPQLMSNTNHVYFQHYQLLAGQAVQTFADPGLRFYMTDPTPEPFAIQHFPNLNLGRHHIKQNQIVVRVKAIGLNNQIVPLYSYSLVLEWDTE